MAKTSTTKKSTAKTGKSAAKKSAAIKQAEAEEGVLDNELIARLDDFIKDSGKKVERSVVESSFSDDDLSSKQMAAVFEYLTANGIKLTGKSMQVVEVDDDEDIDAAMSDEEIMEGIPERGNEHHAGRSGRGGRGCRGDEGRGNQRRRKAG